MSLKQSVVIVNQFTVKTGSGSGTRGGSPGEYVLRYMARDKAVETVTPVKLTETEDFIMRYMARKEASETLESVPEIKSAMRDAEGNGGVAFGYGDVSLSHEKLMAASADIQEQFDNGKTVMKTVLSFAPGYLRQMGVVPPDFVCRKAGDYRGNLDQMKLRMAVMAGLDNLKREYSDLQYVGVLQVDTKHVHCHLAMVDRGVGRLADDGTQKGKISEKMKAKLRRGIDSFLDETVQVKTMYSNINRDKRNALCYIKKFTHKTMDKQGIPQFLLACLPKDKRLWRAGSNRSDMKKPNYIVREYVTQVLAQPDSGYKEAMRGADKHARRRQKQEGLTNKQYRQVFKAGREAIINDCMNGVYAVLKQVPNRQKQVRTPMMVAMSQSYEDMASELGSDPMVEFGFKLRSYSTRLDFHKKETSRYHEAVSTYAKTPDISESARPLLDFLKHEEDYNAKLMSKYQHFLKFLPGKDEFDEDFEKIGKFKRRLSNLEKLKADPACKRMTPENAEDYGRRVYETKGGQYVITAPGVLEQRHKLMLEDYDELKEKFRLRVAAEGLTLHTDEADDLSVLRKTPYEFDDVKMLDLHHLGFDFPDDIRVSRPNVEAFVKATETRYDMYTKACAYLKNSGQEDSIAALPNQDVILMKDLSDRIAATAVLPSIMPASSGSKSGRTVRLGTDYQRDIDLVIRMTVESSVQLDGME